MRVRRGGICLKHGGISRYLSDTSSLKTTYLQKASNPTCQVYPCQKQPLKLAIILASNEFESLRRFAPLFPHRHSVLSRRLRVCLCFRYGCVHSLGYCLSRRYRPKQPWRFEFINNVRSTKKRDIRHLGQLVVYECLYLFFTNVR